MKEITEILNVPQEDLANKIADIVKDTKILDFARKEASLLLKNDPDLSKADNINIARSYGPYSREKTGWSRIS